MANAYRSVLAASGPAPTGGDALPAEVLSGKTFTNDNGAQTGTMANNGAVSQTIQPGGSYTIPEGYHNGSGTVTAAQASGYDIVELITVRVGSGASHADRTLTVQTGDYLALADSDSTAYIAGTSDITIAETSDITISGAVKIYKVTQGTTGASSTVRILAGGDTYGVIVHFRNAS